MNRLKNQLNKAAAGEKLTLLAQDQLELGLAALVHKKFDLVEFYILPLLSNKDDDIRSSAFNAMAILAKEEDGDLDLAAQYWEKSIKASSKNQAPALNLAMLQVRFGYYDLALKNLEKVDGNWLVDSLNMIVASNLGEKKKSFKICRQISKSKIDDIATNFNCGLYFLSVGKEKCDQIFK